MLDCKIREVHNSILTTITEGGSQSSDVNQSYAVATPLITSAKPILC